MTPLGKFWPLLQVSLPCQKRLMLSDLASCVADTDLFDRVIPTREVARDFYLHFCTSALYENTVCYRFATPNGVSSALILRTNGVRHYVSLRSTAFLLQCSVTS